MPRNSSKSAGLLGGEPLGSRLGGQVCGPASFKMCATLFRGGRSKALFCLWEHSLLVI
jgi:hypothetical protein